MYLLKVNAIILSSSPAMERQARQGGGGAGPQGVSAQTEPGLRRPLPHTLPHRHQGTYLSSRL